VHDLVLDQLGHARPPPIEQRPAVLPPLHFRGMPATISVIDLHLCFKVTHPNRRTLGIASAISRDADAAAAISGVSGSDDAWSITSINNEVRAFGITISCIGRAAFIALPTSNASSGGDAARKPI
jgi:hypothetical protein